MLFQLCTRVPPFCPGKGNWTFVLDLANVDADDIAYDEYGKWGRPGGRRIYLQPDKNGRLVKIAEGRQPASPWTVLVRSNRYVHPSVSSGEFSKITYVARDFKEKIAVGNAVITYSVQVNLSEVMPLAHKTAKDQGSSFQRVKPSTRKLAKEALASETPKHAFHTVLEKKGGVLGNVTPSDLPRNTQQLRLLKATNKIPGKTVTAAGRPAKGNIEEVLKMLQSPDSFVRDSSTVAPEKEADPLCFRIFLADR